MTLTKRRHFVSSLVLTLLVGIQLLGFPSTLYLRLFAPPAYAPSRPKNIHRVNNRHVVITWGGYLGMYELVSRHWSANLLCETIDPLRKENPQVFITVNITFGCQDVFDKTGAGTGNLLGLFYGMRLSAYVYGDVEIYFNCHDAEQTKEDLVLPWVTGFFPARPLNQSSLIPITIEESCGLCYEQPIGYLYREIWEELRSMAVGRGGIPSSDHPSAAWFEHHEKEENKKEFEGITPRRIPQLPLRPRVPPLPAEEWDDAVLHFRCGDLMDSDHWSFAFMKFSGYVRHIDPSARSIGIITQPLDDQVSQTRVWDSAVHLRQRCRIVVDSLVDYIQERYPAARVRIHHRDSIALAYARMVMASGQAIAGLSTFGVIPAVSSFGTSHIRAPDQAHEVNHWLIQPPRIDNIVLTQDEKVPVAHIKGLWETEGAAGVLAWFWNDTQVEVEDGADEQGW